MNIQLETRSYATPSEMMASYAAIRRRMMAPKRPATELALAVSSSADAPVIAKSRVVAPCLNVEKRFDHHVVLRNLWLKLGPIRFYIHRRSTELGQRYRDVIGPTKTDPVSSARQLIMWEIKRELCPEISYPQLGRLFGRDHTTAIHAVMKIDAGLGDIDALRRYEARKARMRRYRADEERMTA